MNINIMNKYKWIYRFEFKICLCKYFWKKYTVDQTEITVLLDIVLGKSVSVK